MKLFKNRTVLGIFCIAVSLIICFAITPLVNAGLSKKVTIVRFNRQVNEVEEITRSMLDEVEVGNHNLPENVIRNIADVEGKYLTATVYAGDYILTDKISDEPAAENKYLYSLNGELKYVEVIAVTAKSGYDANTGEKLSEEEDGQPVMNADSQETFHGVPGGHEFTSFVLGMYNAAGPGQAMDEDIRKRIKGIENQVDIKILVSLSCTMCPDLVIATQHMAAIGEHITTEVYDIHHFESLKNKYKVMSVPCMVINDEQVYFGKKNLQQILEIVEGIVK